MYSRSTEESFSSGSWMAYYPEFWEYDSVIDEWTRKANVPSKVRSHLDMIEFIKE
jgi:hypothetical protein